MTRAATHGAGIGRFGSWAVGQEAPRVRVGQAQVVTIQAKGNAMIRLEQWEGIGVVLMLLVLAGCSGPGLTFGGRVSAWHLNESSHEVVLRFYDDTYEGKGRQVAWLRVSVVGARFEDAKSIGSLAASWEGWAQSGRWICNRNPADLRPGMVTCGCWTFHLLEGDVIVTVPVDYDLLRDGTLQLGVREFVRNVRGSSIDAGDYPVVEKLAFNLMTDENSVKEIPISITLSGSRIRTAKPK